MTQANYMKQLLAILPGRPITDPREFNDLVAKIEQSGCANILCATRYIDSIPAYQAVSFRVVTLSAGDFYQPRGWGNGELAPTGTAVQKLFREAGGVILQSQRQDDGTDANYRHMLGGVKIRQMNGHDESFWKSRTIDLRPGAPEAEAMKDRQLAAARQHIHQVAETKAQLRAMRAGLGLAQSYKEEDARKPFVIPTLVANLDLTNPVHSNLAAAHAIGAVEQLYGSKREEEQEALPPASVTLDGELIEDAPGQDDGEGEDEFPEPEAPSSPRCDCPCGCTAEISDAVAQITGERIGRRSCSKCYPRHRDFDSKAHERFSERELVPKVA